MIFWSWEWIPPRPGLLSRSVLVTAGASFQFHPQAASLVRLEEVPAALSVEAQAEPASAAMEALAVVQAEAVVAVVLPESRALSASAEAVDQVLRVRSHRLLLRAWLILSPRQFFPRSVRVALSFRLGQLEAVGSQFIGRLAAERSIQSFCRCPARIGPCSIARKPILLNPKQILTIALP